SASQNAQHYYRLYAKSRTRTKTADASSKDAADRLDEVKMYSQSLDAAETMQDLQILKESVLDRGKKIEQARQPSSPQQKERTPQQRLMSTKSSDGFTIIVGRNRLENDVLVSKLTLPHDIWMHAQGLEGAHAVIKLPNKKDPPQTTLKEAGQIVARFSKIGLGARVNIVYTYGKWVKKIGKDKPGMVRYENEKTLEIDTAAPMPASLRRLFS
ncbi:MAG: NFACT RNA binding domain-containing protein, partial [Candidatus Obscuribacterales bacterium]|nr:NFACT RNA binding domain-containing protein [Candidatus Obscuribacterales bacterium]